MEKGQYSAKDTEVMCITAQSRNASRIKELVNFIKLNGYKKIGIANCFCVNNIALELISILKAEGIESISIHCKESGLDASELSDAMKGASCDPKSQAAYLNQENTDFNINLGLCLGHGLLFQKYSNAPVTTLLVKDACHKHNIMENFA